MPKSSLPGLLLALALGPVAGFALPKVASAQVDVRVRLPLPTIRFEVPPPLVVVNEGVEVVPDCPEEVFHRDGWYWHRTEGRWYRTRDHRGGWVFVESRQVPVVLVDIPRGKYKHHKHKGEHPGRGHGKHKHKHQHQHKTGKGK